MAHRLRVIPALHVRAATAQLALAAIGLLLCLLLPRPGGAVLLVPITAPAPAVLGAFGSGQHVAVLRGGMLSHGMLVRVDGAVPVLRLLRMGVLPIGAPAFLCRSGEPPVNQELDRHG